MVLRTNVPHLSFNVARHTVPASGPRQMPAGGSEAIRLVPGAGRNPDAVRVAGQVCTLELLSHPFDLCQALQAGIPPDVHGEGES